MPRQSRDPRSRGAVADLLQRAPYRPHQVPTQESFLLLWSQIEHREQLRDASPAQALTTGDVGLRNLASLNFGGPRHGTAQSSLSCRWSGCHFGRALSALPKWTTIRG